jgi:oligopeptide transport system permease protein
MRIAGWTIVTVALAALLLPLLLPWSYDQIDWNHVRAAPFTHGHLLGTDSVGRDLLARTLIGTRITLAVAGAAALVALLIGTAWGAIAGWAGGRVDEAMMRVVDALYALPFMFVVILLMVAFGRSIILVFLGIGAVEWLTMARVVRGQVMALRHRPYVLAAEAAGAPPRAIVARHILPNVAGVALAYLVLTVPQVVMVESFLSFLGLGVQEPLTSLGILVHDGAEDMDVAPLALLVPGGVLVGLILALTALGERLRDRLAR